MKKNQQGHILLISVIFFAVILALVAGLMQYVMQNTQGGRLALAEEQAQQITDGAIDKAVFRLNSTAGAYTGETGSVLGNGTFDVTVANVAGGNKEITVTAYIPNSANPVVTKEVKVEATIDSTTVNFNYGVQVGQGGIQMNSNSRVNGNVYSNGNIIGSSGTRITGTAIAAGSTGKIDNMIVNGNAAAHFLEDITVGGSSSSASLLRATVGANAISDSISNCTIGGNAAYDTRVSCTIGGTVTTPNPDTFIDPAILPLPLSSTQLTDWENEALVGGTIGSQTLSGNQTLGPVQINGNLTLTNNAVLTLNGTVWVTGTITLSNNVTVRLASSYGSGSGVLLGGTAGSSTNGVMNLSNNVIMQGSGTAGSYLLVVSQRNDTVNPAMIISNNVTGAIFYAGTGVIQLSNNSGAEEVTAYKIVLDNNAVVTYTTGLANVEFTSGPGGLWVVQRGTWRETD